MWATTSCHSQLAVMASDKKAPPAAAGAEDGDHGGSSDDFSHSGDSEIPRRRRDFSSDNDEDQKVRQGKGISGRRPFVPSLPSSSTSSGDEVKNIVDLFDAIKSVECFQRLKCCRMLKTRRLSDGVGADRKNAYL